MTILEQINLKIQEASNLILQKVDAKLATWLPQLNKIDLLYQAVQFLYDRLGALTGRVTTVETKVTALEASQLAQDATLLEHANELLSLKNMLGDSPTNLKGETYYSTVDNLLLPTIPLGDSYLGALVVEHLHSANNSVPEVGTYQFIIKEGNLLININGEVKEVDNSDIIVAKYVDNGGQLLLESIKVTKLENGLEGSIGTITLNDLTVADPNGLTNLSPAFLLDLGVVIPQ
jgi:DNA-directed RNA polymerase beta subunit